MLLFASVVLVAVTAASTDLEVEVTGVREIRGSGSAAAGDPSPGLTVFLDVPALEKRLLQWEIEVTEASDDAGNDLMLPKAPQIVGSRFRELPGGENVLRVDLGPSARQAEQIAELKGKLHLVVGDGEQMVTVPRIKTWQGKTVGSPSLEAMGITVQVPQQGRFNQRELTVMISAESLGGDVEVSVVAADGTSISAGGTGHPGETVSVWTEELERPLRDSDVLKLSIEAAEQQTITIPFDLDDIPLP